MEDTSSVQTQVVIHLKGLEDGIANLAGLSSKENNNMMRTPEIFGWAEAIRNDLVKKGFDAADILSIANTFKVGAQHEYESMLYAKEHKKMLAEVPAKMVPPADDPSLITKQKKKKPKVGIRTVG